MTDHPRPSEAASAASAAPAPVAKPEPNWRRLLIFLGVLALGMGLAWLACEFFPADPPRARPKSQDPRNSRLLEIGLLRDSMPPLRNWNYIVLHHSAAEGDTLESIDVAHRQRGWDGIGYHFLIGDGRRTADGRVQPTFRWWEQKTGAHAMGNRPEVIPAAAATDLYNSQGLGIVLLGDFTRNPPSRAQLDSCVQLAAALAERFDIPMANIIVHRDVTATECPGEKMPVDDLLRRIADRRLNR